MKEKRIDLIEDYIIKKKNVSLDELCSEFDVSLNTIRRDISTLADRGSVKKVYGGVTALEGDTNFKTLTPFSKRINQMESEKDRICRTAASFINDYDIIYIDTGTTAQNLIDYIADKSCIILTNSLQLSIKAIEYPHLEVFSLPGRLKRETLSFAGNEADIYLKNYNISKAFMCSTGVSVKNGLTNASNDEYLVKKAVMQNSNTHYLLTDHSKFDKFTLLTYAELSEIEHVITDKHPKQEYLDYFKEHNTTLHIAD